MMVQECRNKIDLILHDKEVYEKLLQTTTTQFKGGWHRERPSPTVPITFLFFQGWKITSPIQSSKTNQIIRTFSWGQHYLSQENPSGFCDISSTTAPIRTGLGFTRAGVFVNLITQRRSRLGLLCRNANAGVHLHFIFESVLKIHRCLSLYK